MYLPPRTVHTAFLSASRTRLDSRRLSEAEGGRWQRMSQSGVGWSAPHGGSSQGSLSSAVDECMDCWNTCLVLSVVVSWSLSGRRERCDAGGGRGSGSRRRRARRSRAGELELISRALLDLCRSPPHPALLPPCSPRRWHSNLRLFWPSFLSISSTESLSRRAHSRSSRPGAWSLAHSSSSQGRFCTSTSSSERQSG